MKQTVIIIAAAILGAVAYWLISPLFIDVEVQDELDPVLQARLEAQRKVDEARQEREQAQTEQTEDSAPDVEPETTVDEFGVQTTGPFPIEHTAGHPASGMVELIDSPEEKLVYYQNYDGTNGPDLRIYLSKDLEATDFIDLGKAKGNKGDLIYGVPLDVDFSEYKYVLTWCEAFGVLFDYAEIN